MFPQKKKKKKKKFQVFILLRAKIKMSKKFILKLFNHLSSLTFCTHNRAQKFDSS